MGFLYEVNHLSLHVKGKAILSNISFRVEPGQCVAFVGPNGAGKSSLFNLLAGATPKPPTSGELFFKGRPVSSWAPNELATHRAFLSQENAAQLPFLAKEVVAMGFFPYQLSAAEQRNHLGRAEDFSLVAPHLNQPYNSLSGGEKKRVHLARVFVQLSASDRSDKVLLLDEPFAALDLAHQVHLVRRLRLLAKSGTTLLLVLHDLRLASQLADKVVALSNGELATEGSVGEVLSQKHLQRLFGLEPNDAASLGFFDAGNREQG